MPRTLRHLQQVFDNGKMSGDGQFTEKCSDWMKRRFSAPHVLLTTSGTHALEMAARLCNLTPGDEVIMPSYTFSSTANAFVTAGAHIVFVDIRPDTMNINEQLIESAITPRTRVIVPVHYAGVACEMDSILKIAKKHRLLVVEDAAQGMMSLYNGKTLGTLSDFGCYSFHETKNFSMGEGGALLFNDDAYLDRAEVMREKGTDRSKFFRKQIDKYSWMDWGSSFLPSDLNAAYLWSQLEYADEIIDNRLRSWERYYTGLLPLAEKGRIELPFIPEECVHNAHMFYIKSADLDERTRLLAHLSSMGVGAVYHYVPLHTSRAGKKFGTFLGKDRYTTNESNRLLRLPMYYRLGQDAIDFVVKGIYSFYGQAFDIVRTPQCMTMTTENV
jgi:dTDP-4-amino-4,6-dideoxygalactose transaminase